MKVELKEQGPIKKTMEVEVEPDVVEQETAEVVRAYARKAKIPGFRPGKAPASVIRARFAHDIEHEVRDRLLSRLFHAAAQEKGLRPLGGPVLDEVKHEPGQPFWFKTTFEVLPEFEVKKYKDVEVRRPEPQVTDEDVDKAVEELRQSRARLVTDHEREAAIGDYVVLDLEGQPEEGEAFQREKTLVEVGADDNLPAFNEHLPGARAGAEIEFETEYPENYPAEHLAGKKVTYRVEVQEVKRKELPDVDDEFAKDLGEFDDLAALKARIREDVLEGRKAEAEREIRQTVLDKVLLENPIPLPEALVEDEIKHRLEDTIRMMMMQGMDPRRMDLDWKELRDKQTEPARKSVHARLILDAVAGQESIEVGDDEVEVRIREEAEKMGEKPQAFKKKLSEGGGLEALKNQMVREKSLDLLTSVANIHMEAP